MIFIITCVLFHSTRQVTELDIKVTYPLGDERDKGRVIEGESERELNSRGWAEIYILIFQ